MIEHNWTKNLEEQLIICIQKKVVTRKLIQALKHDSEYQHIREIAQSPEVSKTPIMRSNFSDYYKVQRKNIQRLDKELKMLEKGGISRSRRDHAKVKEQFLKFYTQLKEPSLTISNNNLHLRILFP